MIPLRRPLLWPDGLSLELSSIGGSCQPLTSSETSFSLKASVGGAARVGVRRETYDDLLAPEVEVY